MRKAAILVAEDNSSFRALLLLALEGEGFEVVTARDAVAALELIGEHRPDLIVTDLMMPELSGIDFIRRLRGNEESAAIPVIATSAYGDEYLTQAIEAGATAVIDKEDLGRLVETVNKVLAEAGKGDGAASP